MNQNRAMANNEMNKPDADTLRLEELCSAIRLADKKLDKLQNEHIRMTGQRHKWFKGYCPE